MPHMLEMSRNVQKNLTGLNGRNQNLDPPNNLESFAEFSGAQMSTSETWQAYMKQVLAEPPVSRKVYWLYDLKRFDGWQDFIKMLKKEHGAICFSYKTSEHVADAYNGQRIVVFCLAGCEKTDNLKPVLRQIANLKRGILFCSERGVQEWTPPHVVVFADFAKPEDRKIPCRAEVKSKCT